MTATHRTAMSEIAPMTGYIIRRLLWGVAAAGPRLRADVRPVPVLPDRQPGAAAGRARPAAEADRTRSNASSGWTNRCRRSSGTTSRTSSCTSTSATATTARRRSRTLISERLPATISLTRRRGRPVDRDRRPRRSGSSRRCARHSRLDRARDGQRARARLGARILARAGRCCTCSPRTSASSRSSPAPAATSALTERSVEMVHLADPAVVRARGRHARRSTRG